jgi:hypothetical protein
MSAWLWCWTAVGSLLRCGESYLGRARGPRHFATEIPGAAPAPPLRPRPAAPAPGPDVGCRDVRLEFGVPGTQGGGVGSSSRPGTAGRGSALVLGRERFPAACTMPPDDGESRWSRDSSDYSDNDEGYELFLRNAGNAAERNALDAEDRANARHLAHRAAQVLRVAGGPAGGLLERVADIYTRWLDQTVGPTGPCGPCARLRAVRTPAGQQGRAAPSGQAD